MQISPGLNYLDIGSIAINSNDVIYISTIEKPYALFKSNDNGNSWSQVSYSPSHLRFNESANNRK